MEQIKQLIHDRKVRLSLFSFEQSLARMAGLRDKTADVSEAVDYNRETDQEMIDHMWFNVELPHNIKNEIPF